MDALKCVVIFAVLQVAVAIDTSGCGSTKNCLYFPDGCSPTEPTCIFFSYIWDSSSNVFNMELTGGTGNNLQYVAAALATSPAMQDAELYYCTGADEIKSGTIRTARNSPTPDATLQAGIVHVSAQTLNGVAECIFQRPGAITKTISAGADFTFNLQTTPFNVLVARGAYTGGSLTYHGGAPGRASTTNQIDFVVDPAATATTAPTTITTVPTTATETTATTTAAATTAPATTAAATTTAPTTATETTATTTAPATTAAATTTAPTTATATATNTTTFAPTTTAATTTTPTVSSSSDFDEGCGSTKTCFRSPTDCTAGTSGCLFTSWIYNSASNNFDFELVGATSGRYVAVAFSNDNLMESDDLYYCTSSALVSGAIQAARTSPPPLVDPLVGVSAPSFAVDGGVLSCTFTRDASVTKPVSSGNRTFDFQTTRYFVFMATGDVSGGVIQYHTRNGRYLSDRACNFTAPPGSAGSSIHKRNMVNAHASLMILAWLTFTSMDVGYKN